MPNRPKDKGVNVNTGGIGSIYRQILPFISPDAVFDGNFWRRVCYNQPIIMDCISSIMMYVSGLPYQIQARDADKSEELKSDIEYYNQILNDAQDGEGFLSFLSYYIEDLYMIPFGVGVETVRYSDDKLYKIRVLDGSTLYPNPTSKDYKVIQYVPELVKDPVLFNDKELVRSFQFPRPELNRRGWQVAPPERIYLAIEMLNRGDKYYANLLLDTPEAGILDLMDMSKESAEKWLDGVKTLFSGIDSFKIPVIYEHTKDIKYIPFGRPPIDMTFSEVTLKYAQIAVAAFGITLGDIGMKGNNGSLSDSIRDERQSKSTGKAFIKKNIERTMNKILPKELQFVFIDTDDELLVAKGRARSANAVAMRNLVEGGIITPDESRAQLKADGLISIPLKEKPNDEEFEIVKEINGLNDQKEIQEEQIKLQKQQMTKLGSANLNKKGGQAGTSLNKRRNVRGGKLETVQGKDPTPASKGGQGEVKSMIIKSCEDYFNISQPDYQLFLTQLINKLESINKAEIDEKNKFTESLFENSENDLFIQIKTDLRDKFKVKAYLDEDTLNNKAIQYFENGLHIKATEIQKQLYDDGQSEMSLFDGLILLRSDYILDSIYDEIVNINNRLNDNLYDMFLKFGIATVLNSEETDEINNLIILYKNMFDDYVNNLSDNFENELEEVFLLYGKNYQNNYYNENKNFYYGE